MRLFNVNILYMYLCSAVQKAHDSHVTTYTCIPQFKIVM